MYQALQAELDAAGADESAAPTPRAVPAIVEELAVAMVLALRRRHERRAWASCTARARARRRWWLTRAPAAWMRPSKPARRICSSPTRRSIGSDHSPNATRRCDRRAEVERLWAALTAGLIDYIGTDHSPVPRR